MAAFSRRSPTDLQEIRARRQHRSGRPNENNRMLLIAGKIDFFMAANTLMSFDAVANDVPAVTIAAIFQKDPQVMLTQPDAKV